MSISMCCNTSALDSVVLWYIRYYLFFFCTTVNRIWLKTTNYPSSIHYIVELTSTPGIRIRSLPARHIHAQINTYLPQINGKIMRVYVFYAIQECIKRSYANMTMHNLHRKVFLMSFSRPFYLYRMQSFKCVALDVGGGKDEDANTNEAMLYISFLATCSIIE